MAKETDTITLSRNDLSALLDQMLAEKLATMTQASAPSIEGNLKIAELAQVMKDSSEAQRQAEYEARLKATEAEIALGLTGRSQVVCDQKYPKAAGDRQWRIKLDDRNGQPELTVWAPTAEDGRGRYQQVCGITAVTDRKSKWVVEPVS